MTRRPTSDLASQAGSKISAVHRDFCFQSYRRQGEEFKFDRPNVLSRIDLVGKLLLSDLASTANFTFMERSDFKTKTALPTFQVGTSLGVTWILLISLVIVGQDWEPFRRMIAWQRFHPSWLDQAILAVVLWARALWLLFPTALLVSPALRRRSRFVEPLAILLASLTIGWLWIDRRLRASTGRGAVDFLPFVFDPSTWEYGGRQTTVVQDIIGLGLASFVFVGCSWGVLRVVERRGTPSINRLVNRSALVAMVVVMLGWAPFARQARLPEVRDSLLAILSPPPPMFGVRFPIQGDWLKNRAEINRRLQPIAERILTAPLDGISGPTPWSSRPLPDVLIVFVESFRHDILTPTDMPKLTSWSEQGARGDRHYAGSNCSHLGMFALLFGLHPIHYDRALNELVEPDLLRTFKNLGYETAFFGSADFSHFKRMEEFVRPGVFDHFVTDAVGRWPERDRRTLNHVSAWLSRERSGERSGDARVTAAAHKPRLAIAFLMSTHFGFDYPPEWEIHRPVAERFEIFSVDHKSQCEGLLNRYRNAALFIDDELARLFARLDHSNLVSVVTGDHGESIGEDGAVGHWSRLSEIQTRVPLIMVGPTIPAGFRIPTASTHMDLLPTLRSFLGGPARGATESMVGRGRDLLARDPRSEDRALLFQRCEGHSADQMLLIDGPTRLKLRVRPDPPLLEVVGFVDALDRPLAGRTVDLEVVDDWVTALSRRLGVGSTTPVAAATAWDGRK